jgi:hypothetical protein
MHTRWPAMRCADRWNAASVEKGARERSPRATSFNRSGGLVDLAAGRALTTQSANARSAEHRQQLEAVAYKTRSTSSLGTRRQIDADTSRHQTGLTNTNVAIAIRADMQPVGWEKDLAPRPAFVSAKTHDLMALHRMAVLLVAAFLIIEVVTIGESANEHCSAD